MQAYEIDVQAGSEFTESSYLLYLAIRMQYWLLKVHTLGGF